jgi:hypothetical protein
MTVTLFKKSLRGVIDVAISFLNNLITGKETHLNTIEQIETIAIYFEVTNKIYF